MGEIPMARNNKHRRMNGKATGRRGHGGKKKESSFPYLRYIPCMAEPGMFRGEWLVFLDVVDPENPDQTIRAQCLVDQREVANLMGTPQRSKPVRGWLRVALVDHRKGFAQVILPQPAVPVGESIFMDEDLVKEEAGT
jgi:hypothetical protein